MSSRDIRDIMGVAQSPAGPCAALLQHRTRKTLSSASRKGDIFSPTASKKMPEGMTREVYNLLYNDNKDGPPLMPSDTLEYDKGYKQLRAKLGTRKTRKWRWTPFKNPGRGPRKDDLILYHWRRAEDDAPSELVVQEEYEFAKLNVAVDHSIVAYTDAEYVSHLQVDDWNRSETDHLLDLCQRFDLRFPIVHDRWDRELFKRSRTIEDLKERYYGIAEKMTRVRELASDSPTHDSERKSYVFDANHERRRKEQLNKLYNRTPEQIEEEEMLKQELRRIEQRRREREQKNTAILAASDAHSTSTGHGDEQESNVAPTADSPRSPSPGDRKRGQATTPAPTGGGDGSSRSSAGGSSSGLSLGYWIDLFTSSVSFDGRPERPELTPSAVGDTLGQLDKLLATMDGLVGIKFPDASTVSSASLTSGVTTRSARLKLPSSVGLRRTRAVDTMLSRLHVTSPASVASLEIVEQYNGLRSELATLFELKAALSAVVSSTLQSELDGKTTHKHETPAHMLRLMHTDSANATRTDVIGDEARLSDVVDILGVQSGHSVSSSAGSRGSSSTGSGSPTVTSVSETMIRKRKAAIEQGNVLKKIKNKNF